MQARETAQNKTSSSFISRFSSKLKPVTITYLKKKYRTDDFGCVYIGCSYQGMRSEKSTGVYIEEKFWDQTQQAIIGNPELSQEIWAAKQNFVELITEGLNYSQELTGSEASLKMAALSIRVALTSAFRPASR